MYYFQESLIFTCCSECEFFFATTTFSNSVRNLNFVFSDLLKNFVEDCNHILRWMTNMTDSGPSLSPAWHRTFSQHFCVTNISEKKCNVGKTILKSKLSTKDQISPKNCPHTRFCMAPKQYSFHCFSNFSNSGFRYLF